MAHAKNSAPPRRGRPQSEPNRNVILESALVEFAREGLAGARVEAIAEAAGVNKALLYYYFQDKETLYGAVLDRFFEALAQRIFAVCRQPGTAGNRFLSYVRTHFDAIAESPYYAAIFMSELMSAGRGGSPHLDRIFSLYMQPIGKHVLALIEEGVRSREFRRVDPNQFLPSAIGSIVHYFLTAPVRQKFLPTVDFTRPEFIVERRAATLDFIAAALFDDRELGIALAAKLAEQPTASRRDERVAQKQTHQRQHAASPLGRPRSPQTPPPTEPVESAREQFIRKGGYQYENRWFPDVETAKKVFEEEARQRQSRSKSRRKQGKDGAAK